MNPQEHEGDGDLVALLDRSVGAVRFDQETDRIAARGRSLRRRRRAVPVLATAGVLAASLSIAAVTQTQSGSPARTGGTLAWGGTAVNVDNASYSVHTDAKTGVVTVRLSTLGDPTELQALLRKAGIPLVIVVRQGTTSCSWTGAKPESMPPGAVSNPTVDGNGSLTETSTITFDPAKLRKGEVLGFIEMESHGRIGATDMEGLSTWPTGCA